MFLIGSFPKNKQSPLSVWSALLAKQESLSIASSFLNWRRVKTFSWGLNLVPFVVICYLLSNALQIHCKVVDSSFSMICSSDRLGTFVKMSEQNVLNVFWYLFLIFTSTIELRDISSRVLIHGTRKELLLVVIL